MSITELIILGAFAMPFLLVGTFIFGYFYIKKINTSVEKNSKSLKTNMKSWESKISKSSGDVNEVQKRLEHLETIVTSELWDEFQKKGIDSDLGFLIDDTEIEISESKKVEKMANKIR